jgi:hypothetical protein
MEVHAHTHTSRKKWTHYLWEFLMLFLAVFCGFLAENFREHQVEKHRAKQYVLSFYEDLKKDTTRLGKVLEVENKKIESLSHLKNCYDSLVINPTVTTCLFEIIKNSAFNNPGVLTDRTLKQLANAGGYRLLEKEDADSIIGYDNASSAFVSFNLTAYQEAQDNVRTTFNSAIDFTANTELYSNVTASNSEYVSVMKTPLLFSNDKALLNKYFNELFQYLRVIVGHRNRIISLKEKATGLILFFKQEYHLK